jgi:hypothetical protein
VSLAGGEPKRVVRQSPRPRATPVIVGEGVVELEQHAQHHEHHAEYDCAHSLRMPDAAVSVSTPGAALLRHPAHLQGLDAQLWLSHDDPEHELRQETAAYFRCKVHNAKHALGRSVKKITIRAVKVGRERSGAPSSSDPIRPPPSTPR